MNFDRGLRNLERILNQSGAGNDSEEYLDFAGWSRQLRSSVDNERKFAILDPQEQRLRETVLRELDRLALRLAGKSFLDLCLARWASVPQHDATSHKPTRADKAEFEASVTADRVENKPCSERRLRVFLCHSSEDKPAVRGLYHRLLDEDVDPWLDEEKILPGQDWQEEISKAVQEADVVLVCLSKGSINKKGYAQKEIKDALDVADQQPQGAIFIIPLKLGECDIPNRLRFWQSLDFFEERGYKRLLDALRARASEVGATLRFT